MLSLSRVPHSTFKYTFQFTGLVTLMTTILFNAGKTIILQKQYGTEVVCSETLNTV